MDQRKSKKANLEKSRQVFLGIGFLLIFGVVFAAFTYKTYDQILYDFTVSLDEDLEEIPPTVNPEVQQQKLDEPPPPPPKEPEIEIVDDEEETPEDPIDDPEPDPEDDIPPPEDDSEDEGEALDKDIPMMRAENMPYYPGCEHLKGKEQERCTQTKIIQFSKDAFVLPDIAREMGYEGTVYLKFVVNRKGLVTNVEVIKGVNEILDKAAIAAVKKLPRFNPGMSMDKPQSIIYNIPVRIKYR